MTVQSRDVVLFPDEIIPWDEVVRLVTILLVPFRHHAKGIDCITGRFSSHQLTPTGPITWFPYPLSESLSHFIKEHLDELPPLAYPIPIGIARDFIDNFIVLRDSPDTIPSFLTRASLQHDREIRESLFIEEKKHLQRLVSKNNTSIIDASRHTCTHLTHGVYFTRKEAIRYLDQKGLIDRALISACSWKDKIREPEFAEDSSATEDTYHGFSKELISIGTLEYRKLLIIRRFEAIETKHISEPRIESLEHEKYIKDEPSDINTKKTMTENSPRKIDRNHNQEVNVLDPSQPAPLSTIEDKSSKYDFPPQDSLQYDTKPKSRDTTATTETPPADKNKHLAKKLIGMKEILQLLGISRPTVYNYLNPNSPSYNPKFPQPIKLNSENRWHESEILDFLESLSATNKKKIPVN